MSFACEPFATSKSLWAGAAAWRKGVSAIHRSRTNQEPEHRLDELQWDIPAPADLDLRRAAFDDRIVDSLRRVFPNLMPNARKIWIGPSGECVSIIFEGRLALHNEICHGHILFVSEALPNNHAAAQRRLCFSAVNMPCLGNPMPAF